VFDDKDGYDIDDLEEGIKQKDLSL